MKIPKIFKKREKADIMIVGLGNPGREYIYSPHNAGFEVIDRIYDKFKSEFKIEETEQTKQYNLFRITINNQSVIFIKPLSFMNNSGSVIQKLKREYKVKDENIWIIHDEVDLPIGKIKVSFNSRDAGHKGVQNIIAKLSTQEFYRFRIGVRPPENNLNTTEYVTTPLSSPHKELMATYLQECYILVIKSLEQGAPIKQ